MSKIDLEFIKSKRTEKGLSQQEVAEILGFKNSCNYCKYENGTYKFEAEMLPILAKTFDCKIENFFIKETAKTEKKGEK